MKTKRKSTLKKKVKAKTERQVKVYPKKTRSYHIAIDKRLTAKKVGKRRSASGNIYTERRENRSDVNRKRRL